jgi:hypothetical protein
MLRIQCPGLGSSLVMISSSVRTPRGWACQSLCRASGRQPSCHVSHPSTSHLPILIMTLVYNSQPGVCFHSPRVSKGDFPQGTNRQTSSLCLIQAAGRPSYLIKWIATQELAEKGHCVPCAKSSSRGTTEHLHHSTPCGASS